MNRSSNTPSRDWCAQTATQRRRCTGRQHPAPSRSALGRNASLTPALAVGLVGLAIACGPSEPSPSVAERSASVETADAETPTAGGTLVAATSSDMVGVNELTSSTDRFTQDVIDAMFLHLFVEQPDFDRGPPTMTPQLAVDRSWEESDAGPSLLVRLDPQATWSDGVPITAEDVRWTWQAQISPEVAWPYVESKEAIRDVEVVDEKTVRFHLTHREFGQIQNVNLGVILPRHAWGELPFERWRSEPEWFLEHLVISGPFRLSAWERDVEVVLERNPEYSLGRALLDRIVFRVIPERTSQVEGLLSGELDLIERVPPDEADRIASSERARLVTFWSRQYDFLCWNVANPLFESAEVRRALTLGIDRDSIVETLWGDRARPSKSPIIASVWAHHRELEAHPYSPARAGEILEEAGWSDRDGDGVRERGGGPFRFELLTNGNPIRVNAATMIQQQLERIGVDVEVRVTDFLTAQALTLEHEFEATISGWLIDTSLDLAFAFHSDSIENGYNLGLYSNPELDRLLDEADEISSRDELEGKLHEIQELLHREQPYTQLWEPMGLNGASRRLRNVQSNAQTSYFGLVDWWIAAP